MQRRSFLLSCVSLLAIALVTPAEAWQHGISTPPTTATIPVTSLANGNYPANNWTGFTTTGTTVASHVMVPNPNNQQIFATGNAIWRDQEISTYAGGRATLYLRLGGDGQAIFANFNLTAGNSLNIGIVQGFVATSGVDTGATGTFYSAYDNFDPTGTLAGYGVSGSIYTFGTSGFEIYLKINGVKVCSYIEWRLCRAGQMAVWAQVGVSQDIVATYLPLQFLYSIPANNLFDTRDFGMRNTPATTGSMSAGSNQITGVTAGTFQIGDQIIVCVGGETGVGARGTHGVGGNWPTLNYANTTIMNADTSQAVGTFAYDASEATPISTYAWNGTVWQHNGGGPVYQSYYQNALIPLPLIAKVTGVSGTTLTLDQTASVATINADIRLDCLPSFYVFNQRQQPAIGGGGLGRFAPCLSNMTIRIPSSQGTADQCWYMSTSVQSPDVSLASNIAIIGAGRTLTTLKTPKCCPPSVFDLTPGNNGLSISDFKYIGNNGASGYGFYHTANTYIGYCTAIRVISFASLSTGMMVKNIDGFDPVGQLVVIAGNIPLMDNCTCNQQFELRDYVQWMFQMVNSSGGAIQNCTTTSPYLVKAYEFFACNGTKIINCGGQNVLYSTNSSTSWEIDCRGLTINYTTDCFINQLSGWVDEAIFNVNNNAFGSGSVGTIRLGRHIQQGYVRTSDSTSLKFIQVSGTQTDVSILGSYPGAGGCTNLLDGYMEAPNYNALSPEYGAMAVYSDTARTVVSGIRIKGSAIGTPGHSGHFGNISNTDATSTVTNNVADVIQTGAGTVSGNQTNAAYGGC